jgi:threonine/homoserine/homoserine lactone efflux protein
VGIDASIAGSYKTLGGVLREHRAVEQIAALVGFSIISAGTPGPNNILLWASGAAFGFRRTVPHVVGTAVGIGALTLAVAAGLSVIITSAPGVALAMKIAGSLYLLYLAWQVAGAGALDDQSITKPLSLGQAAAFQVINPKAWIFALGAVTTFRPTAFPTFTGTVLVTITMILVIIPTAALWAAGGGAISRLIRDDRIRRAVNLTLALILAATVVSVWL